MPVTVAVIGAGRMGSIVARHLPGAVILNMATAAFIEPQIRAKAKEALVVDSKIIGQSYTMEREEAAIVVVDPCPEPVFALIQSQLQGLGKVVQ